MAVDFFVLYAARRVASEQSLKVVAFPTFIICGERSCTEGASNSSPGSMAVVRRLFRELQLQCRVPVLRIEKCTANFTTDRRRVRRSIPLPYREWEL